MPRRAGNRLQGQGFIKGFQGGCLEAQTGARRRRRKNRFSSGDHRYRQNVT